MDFQTPSEKTTQARSVLQSNSNKSLVLGFKQASNSNPKRSIFARTQKNEEKTHLTSLLSSKEESLVKTKDIHSQTTIEVSKVGDPVLKKGSLKNKTSSSKEHEKSQKQLKSIISSYEFDKFKKLPNINPPTLSTQLNHQSELLSSNSDLDKELEMLPFAFDLQQRISKNPIYQFLRKNLTYRKTFQEAASYIKANKLNGKIETNESLYKIVKQIGQGNFGQVFLATQLSTNLPVAIKIVPKDLLNDKAIYLKLQNEIKIMKMLFLTKHITPFLENFEDEKKIYCVFEYMPTGDLTHFYEKNRPFQEADLTNLSFKILSGIKSIQQAGIIHRDIKMENILLDEKIEPFICDFGLSMFADEKRTVKDTCGTPTYLAPEIFLQELKVTKKTDMWSFGVLLFNMIYNRLPFGGTTYNELYMNILNENFSFDPETKISKELKDIVSSLLVVDQDKRIGVVQALKHPWLNQSKTQQTVKRMTVDSFLMGRSLLEKSRDKSRLTYEQNRKMAEMEEQNANSSDFGLAKLEEINEKKNLLRVGKKDLQLRAAAIKILLELGWSADELKAELMAKQFSFCSASYWNLVLWLQRRFD